MDNQHDTQLQKHQNAINAWRQHKKAEKEKMIEFAINARIYVENSDLQNFSV